MERIVEKKKSKLFGSLMLLMSLCFITCFTLGIYAKYVVSDKGSERLASAAKFGVKITANGSGFGQKYATDDQEVVGTIAESVVSAGNVIAPGTKGELISISISGMPEVAVAIKYEADFRVTNWVDRNGEYYCPIEITIDDNKKIKGTEFDSFQEFEKAVEEAIADYSANYGAGTDLSTVNVRKPSVSWAWAFDGNEDEKDTDIGNSAANGTVPVIALSLTTTVSQID